MIVLYVVIVIGVGAVAIIGFAIGRVFGKSEKPRPRVKGDIDLW